MIEHSAPGEPSAGATSPTLAPISAPEPNLVMGASTAAADPRPGLSGLPEGVLESWLASNGQPAYRAKQIRDAIWRQHVASPEELHTLPVALRESLGEAFRTDTIVADEVTVADGGLTEKTLHRLSGGALIESVLMHYPARGVRASGRRSEEHTSELQSR